MKPLSQSSQLSLGHLSTIIKSVGAPPLAGEEEKSVCLSFSIFAHLGLNDTWYEGEAALGGRTQEPPRSFSLCSRANAYSWSCILFAFAEEQAWDKLTSLSPCRVCLFLCVLGCLFSRLSLPFQRGSDWALARSRAPAQALLHWTPQDRTGSPGGSWVHSRSVVARRKECWLSLR